MSTAAIYQVIVLEKELTRLRTENARLLEALREIEFLQPGLDREGNLIEGHAAMVAACKGIAIAAIAAAEGRMNVPDKRNQAERLLNEATDYIAATLEQPTDIRAWEHLLIYCPREALERCMARIASAEGGGE